MRKTPRAAAPSELVLDLLLVLFEEARGSGELADELSELRGREVPLATFYRHLQRAVDHGWVAVEEATGERAGPGRPERLYRATDVGERALRAGLELQQRRVARAGALGLLLETGQ